MKRVIVILWIVYLFLSCGSENEIPDEAKKTETKTVTFLLKGIRERHFTTYSRAENTADIDFTRYTVKFYLFEQQGDEYVFIRDTLVNADFFSITGLKSTQAYQYLFVAVSKGFEYMLDTKDCSGWKWTGSNPESMRVTRGMSLLKNCYFPFIEGEDNNALWNAPKLMNPTSFQCMLPDRNKNLEIYGQGYVLTASMDFHNPFQIFRERQYGTVEIRLKKLVPDEKVSVTVSSDYYRIYLSQMIKADANKDYNSLNSGNISGRTGDYATSTVLYPIAFTGIQSVTSAEDTLRLNLPYTTVAKVGSTVTDDKYKVYSMTLTVGSNTYSYTTKFPVYRNGISYFVRKGDWLALEFTAQGDTTPGVDLEEDWNGF